MSQTPQPYSRQEFAGALAANAAANKFNLAILVGLMGAGVLVGGPVIVTLLVALAVYAMACARTFLDSDEADKVLKRVRSERKQAVEAGAKRVDLTALSRDIAAPLQLAREREARIREAIERAELPYTEVSAEVDGFVRYMENSAQRAQLLYEVLRDNPVSGIRERLRDCGSDPSKRQLVEALTQQLAVAERCESQLQRYFDEMERMVVEMDTIRGQLVSVSASSDASNQERLAAEVRGLREEMGSLAQGMSEAFEQRSAIA
jgi:hypothetical protein